MNLRSNNPPLLCSNPGSVAQYTDAPEPFSGLIASGLTSRTDQFCRRLVVPCRITFVRMLPGVTANALMPRALPRRASSLAGKVSTKSLHQAPKARTRVLPGRASVLQVGLLQGLCSPLGLVVPITQLRRPRVWD